MFKTDYNNMMQSIHISYDTQKQILQDIYRQAEQETTDAKRNKKSRLYHHTKQKGNQSIRGYCRIAVAGLCVAAAMAIFAANPIVHIFQSENSSSVQQAIRTSQSNFTVYAGEYKVGTEGTKVSNFYLAENGADNMRTATCEIDGEQANYYVYTANLLVHANEGKQIERVTYNFAKGSGSIGERVAWPDTLQEIYDDGAKNYDDASRKRMNLYNKAIAQYAQEHHVIAQRFTDRKTGSYYMIQYHDNPYEISVNEQPEQLYLFVRFQRIMNQKMSDLEKLQELRNQIENTQFTISVTYDDGTQETQTFGMKVEYDNTLCYLILYQAQ